MRLRLTLAIVFILGALAFAYGYVTSSPWYKLGRSPATAAGGPPAAQPGHGPTPELMQKWMKESGKTHPKP